MSAGAPWPPVPDAAEVVGWLLTQALIRSIRYFLLDYDCGRESYKCCSVW